MDNGSNFWRIIYKTLMKKLIVVRHAKSSWDFPDLDDFDRPLNKRGKQSAPEMGKRLATRGIVPDLIVSSPAKRAITTAKRIAEELKFPKKAIVEEPIFYHDTMRDMVAVLNAIPSDVNILMIFGHNPMLTDLVNHLAGTDIFNIPTCGTVEIDFNVTDWEQVGKAKGKLVFFDYPKSLGEEQAS